MPLCTLCVSDGLGDLAAETTATCRMCGNHYCPAHESEMDNNLCHSCTEAPKLEVKTEPLIDEEGVSHTGRHLTVSGETWFSQCRVISELGDEELSKWIDKYKMLVHDAEKAIDYRRTVLSMLEFEKGERSVKRGKNLVYQGRSIAGIAGSGTSFQVRSTKSTNPISRLATGLKKAGISKDQLLAMLTELQNAKSKTP